MYREKTTGYTDLPKVFFGGGGRREERRREGRRSEGRRSEGKMRGGGGKRGGGGWLCTLSSFPFCSSLGSRRLDSNSGAPQENALAGLVGLILSPFGVKSTSPLPPKKSKPLTLTPTQVSKSYGWNNLAITSHEASAPNPKPSTQPLTPSPFHPLNIITRSRI